MKTPDEGRTWDAATYDRVSTPQLEWAEAVLERLPLEGDETVLDAGCGSGRVTELLLARVPRGRVVAVDADADMVEKARARLGDRATVLHQDLLELDLPEPAGAAFSNAVFHWVLDHERLFARLAGALRPGAPLSAQCGGEGNVAAFQAVAETVMADPRWAARFAGWRRPWNFAGVEETATRLKAAGFRDVEVWLEERPTRPAELREFLRTVCCGPYLDRLPAGEHERFVDRVHEGLGPDPVLDYVRLTFTARR